MLIEGVLSTAREQGHRDIRMILSDITNHVPGKRRLPLRESFQHRLTGPGGGGPQSKAPASILGRKAAKG